MTHRVFCDLETYSTVPIEYGAHRYAEEAKVLLWGYAIDDQPAKVWDLTDGSDMPEDLSQCIEDNYEFVWHNGAAFDCVVLSHAMHINIPFDRIDDTMVRAFSHGLPGALGTLCDVLGVPSDKAKDKDGRRLVRKFCIPNGVPQPNSKTDPEDWAKFVNYCRLDVEALRELDKRLPAWNWGPYDRELFEIDQRINRRGIPVDCDLAKACVALAEKTANRNEDKARELTGGELASARQRDAMLAHILRVYGVSLPDLSKSTIERRLNDPDLPDAVKDLLSVRLASSRSSVLKYKTLLNCVSYDGWLRGTLQFRGASRTGRYCLTGDHEVLTMNGWVRLDAWKGGKIAVWNKDSEAISFQESEALEFDYSGTMYQYDSVRCAQISTPDHRMPYMTKSGRWAVDTVENLAKQACVNIPFTGLRESSKNTRCSASQAINIWNTPGKAHRLPKPTTLQFNGKVYCAKTPTSFFVVRRNGRVWVTGNSGRLFQPQNLSRPTLSQDEIDMGIAAIKGGFADKIYDDPGELMSSCLRGVIQAPAGKKLCVADLSNIEGRMLAWLAGEEWKLDAFREFDTLKDVNGEWVKPVQLLTGDHAPLAVDAKGEHIHKGHDLYKATYGRTFGIDPSEVTKQQRQIGKVLELAMGYQGGVGAFLAFASVYRVDLNQLAKHLWESLGREFLDASSDSYEWFTEKKLTHGLERDTFIALDAVKRAWRAAHPAIVSFWSDTEKAAQAAITDGGVHEASKISFDRVGKWLRMQLPSGRYLCYPGARIPQDGSAPITFLGMNQYTRKFGPIKTFSGKCVENATQGAACDILVEAMRPIEAAGFEIITSVHDEFLTLATPDKSVRELERLMSTPPSWAPDLPLAAAGFEAARYRKE